MIIEVVMLDKFHNNDFKEIKMNLLLKKINGVCSVATALLVVQAFVIIFGGGL